jgi:sulfite reductase (ferredoxin)
VAGIAADEIIDGTPALEEIRDRYIGSPEFSNLPRKFKTAISGSPSLDVAHEANDVSSVGVVHAEFGPGFDVWVGGGLSTNPMFAQRLGAWVSLEEIPEVWVGVVSIFRDHGYRRLRNRAAPQRENRTRR